jgi:hypothetical protein
MKVEDDYVQKRRSWVRLHEKGKVSCCTSLLLLSVSSNCRDVRELLGVAFWVLVERYCPTAVRQAGETESEVSTIAS